MAATSRDLTHQDGSVISNVEKRLILATVHGINKSFEKKIVTGFGLTRNRELRPVVRLVDGNFNGVLFESDDWKSFLDVREKILRYFYAEASDAEKMLELQPLLTTSSCYTVLFTTAYGQRAIHIENTRSDRGDVSSNLEEPAPKRMKTYQPRIVIQCATFENLVCVSACVTERLEYLTRICDGSNQIKNYLLDRIAEESITTNNQLQTLQSRLLRGALDDDDRFSTEMSDLSAPTRHEKTMLVYELTSLFSDYMLTKKD